MKCVKIESNIFRTSNERADFLVKSGPQDELQGVRRYASKSEWKEAGRQYEGEKKRAA
jgi:hypothetical protein